MTKDEAQREAIRCWQELPLANQQLETAPEFARLLMPRLPFDTMGNRERLIAAWLIQDVEMRDRRRDAGRGSRSDEQS